jgi:hypothetical protein
MTEETNLVLRRFAYGVYTLHCKTNKYHPYRSKYAYMRTIAGVNYRASGYDACALKVLWWFIRIFLHTDWMLPFLLGIGCGPTKKRTKNPTRTQCKYVFLIDAFLDVRLAFVGDAY